MLNDKQDSPKNKTCAKCKKNKARSEFPKCATKKDGLHPYCKPCKYKIEKVWRQSTRGKKYRKTYENNYRKSKHGKIRRAAAERRSRQRHPDRNRARTAVGYAVRNGTLPRVTSLQCATCSNPAKEYHHHNGYSEKHKLDVIPLCRACHRNITHSKPPAYGG